MKYRIMKGKEEELDRREWIKKSLMFTIVL